MVTCLSFFSAYILLDLGTTLSMFTPLLANKFDLLPDILHEAFLVSTHMGDSVNAEGVCREVDGQWQVPLKLSWVSLGSNLNTNKMLSMGLGVNENLSYEEVPVEILDHQVKRLRNKEFSTVKVLWRNHLVEGETWEA